MTWRDIAKPIISSVLAANAGADDKTIRRALRDAYPWGERAMHPYKVWCDECNTQIEAMKKTEQNVNKVDDLPLFCGAANSEKVDDRRIGVVSVRKTKTEAVAKNGRSGSCASNASALRRCNVACCS